MAQLQATGVTGSLVVNGNVSASAYTGSLEGTASFATTASQVLNPPTTISTSATTANSTYYPVFVLGTGNQTANIRTSATAFSFNPNSSLLTVGGEILATNQIRTTVSTLGVTGSINIDIAGPSYLTQGSLTGNIIYTASNYAAGRSVTILVINGGTERTLDFPTNWRFISAKPSSILPNKNAILTITSFGTTEGDTAAAWGIH